MSSSKAVDNLNELLERGFHITEVQMIISKEGKKKFKVTVKLLKGSESTVISSDDEKFFGYIIHFKQKPDGYGNWVFMYSSDDAPQKGIDPQPKPLLRPVHVEIGDHVLSSALLVDLISTRGRSGVSTKAIVDVKPELNPKFDLIDTRDQITIFDNSTHQVIYKGWIGHLDFGASIARFECETVPRKFVTEKVNLEFVHLTQSEQLYFVAKKAGVKLDVSNLKINLAEREFIVIVPIKNLVFESNFKFADVDFYSVFDTKDDMIIRKSKMCQRESDWVTSYIRAKVIIKATNHFDALNSGYSKIQGAIDWMVFCNDLTFPVIKEGVKKNFSSYNFFKHYSRIHISPIVYCREKNRENTCVFDTRELVGNQLVIQGDPEEYFKATKSVCEKIFVKDPASLSAIEKNILLSFRWISRTITAASNSDKLLDLWTVIDIIVLRPDAQEQFNATEITAINEKLSELNYSKEKLVSIQNKIKGLNSPSIMDTIRYTISKLGLSISQSELKLLYSTRRKRNDIVHGGKNLEITNEEIEKLRGIIERILIAIVNTT